MIDSNEVNSVEVLGFDEIKRIANGDVKPFTHWLWDNHKNRLEKTKSDPLSETEYLNLIQGYGLFREDCGKAKVLEQLKDHRPSCLLCDAKTPVKEKQ